MAALKSFFARFPGNAVICQKHISVEGDGHCCHRPSSNWESNDSPPAHSTCALASKDFGMFYQRKFCPRTINLSLEDTIGYESQPQAWKLNKAKSACVCFYVYYVCFVLIIILIILIVLIIICILVTQNSRHVKQENK